MSPDAFYIKIAIWSQVVSAVLFMGVLIWLWFKFLQPAILTAQERHNKQIAEAERHRDEAKASLDLLHDEIDGAARDAQSIQERADAQAVREYEATVDEAREAGERSARDAQAEFGRAFVAARDRLKVELLDKALARARDEATRRVDAPANTRLVEEFVTSLERRNG